MDRNDEALRQFGRHLAALRQQKDISLRQLAAASGLEVHQLERIEAGEIDLVYTVLLALAKGLKVTPDQLLEFL